MTDEEAVSPQQSDEQSGALPDAAAELPTEASGESMAEAGGDEPERYGAAEWRDRARSLGVSRHAIAGALASAQPDQEFTADEVHERVRHLLTTPVEDLA